jgi:hypothetical protein
MSAIRMRDNAFQSHKIDQAVAIRATSFSRVQEPGF